MANEYVTDTLKENNTGQNATKGDRVRIKWNQE